MLLNGGGWLCSLTGIVGIFNWPLYLISHFQYKKNTMSAGIMLLALLVFASVTCATLLTNVEQCKLSDLLLPNKVKFRKIQVKVQKMIDLLTETPLDESNSASKLQNLQFYLFSLSSLLKEVREV